MAISSICFQATGSSAALLHPRARQATATQSYMLKLAQPNQQLVPKPRIDAYRQYRPSFWTRSSSR
jgi:hypothetical protein